MSWKTSSRSNKFLLYLFSSVVLCGLIDGAFVFAGNGENARGWIWGGSEEMDANGATLPNSASIDGNENPLGWVSVNNLTADGTVSYGVNIPLSGGAVTGYGWSETLGWVQFNPSNDGSMPSGCSGGVSISTTGSFSGCARVVGIAQEKLVGNSGGWNGWIKMSGVTTTGIPYGVSLSVATVPSSLSGYAWSSELGWVDFSRVTVVANPFVKVCPDINPTLFVGSINRVRAYYFPSGIGSCSDTTNATDVTLNLGTTWQNSNISTVSLSDDSGYKKITALSEGGSRITATYLGLSDDIDVTVVALLCVCSCDADESAEHPVGETYVNICYTGCSTTCVGTKRDHWIEVRP